MKNTKQKSPELETLYRQVLEYLEQQRYSFVDFGIWLRYENEDRKNTEPLGFQISWSPPYGLNVGIVGKILCEPLATRPIQYRHDDPRALDNIKTLINTVSRINEIWMQEKT